MEKQGLLGSEWDTTESRPRKYYIISDEGKIVYEELKKEWRRISKALEEMIKEDDWDEIN